MISLAAIGVTASAALAVSVGASVSGAGTISANGEYARNGTTSGKPRYEKDATTYIFWSAFDGAWFLVADDVTSYWAPIQDVAFPWLATWESAGGDEPAPVVSPL